MTPDGHNAEESCSQHFEQDPQIIKRSLPLTNKELVVRKGIQYGDQDVEEVFCLLKDGFHDTEIRIVERCDIDVAAVFSSTAASILSGSPVAARALIFLRAATFTLSVFIYWVLAGSTAFV